MQHTEGSKRETKPGFPSAYGLLRSAFSHLALELSAAYLRRSPIEKGRWRLISKVLPWSKQRLEMKTPRTVRTRYGFRMRLDTSDWLGRHVFMTGEYEPSTTQVMTSLLQRGDVVIDVGANAGYFTLLAAGLVGSVGKVFAFEPVPHTRQQLACNVRLNQATNVVVCEEAASDRNGESAFFEGLQTIGVFLHFARWKTRRA